MARADIAQRDRSSGYRSRITRRLAAGCRSIRRDEAMDAQAEADEGAQAGHGQESADGNQPEHDGGGRHTEEADDLFSLAAGEEQEQHDAQGHRQPAQPGGDEQDAFEVSCHGVDRVIDWCAEAVPCWSRWRAGDPALLHSGVKA